MRARQNALKMPSADLDLFMKSITFILLLLALFVVEAESQRRAVKSPPGRAAIGQNVSHTAIVMDETISLLRREPSLYADALQRMRRGRKVRIVGVKEADGVRFFRVVAVPPAEGWVQADAVFSERRPEDEERLARLVQALSGFEQIEAAVHFFRMYPNSRLKPAILLLFGDALEDTASRLSRDANNRLDRRQMAASGAPPHSYFLNFVSLDRYRRLGITFLFNPSTRRFHYNGAAWKEIAEKYSSVPEASEAAERLGTLSQKMSALAEK